MPFFARATCLAYLALEILDHGVQWCFNLAVVKAERHGFDGTRSLATPTDACKSFPGLLRSTGTPIHAPNLRLQANDL